MSVKLKFILYVIFFHLLMTVLGYYLLRENVWYFIGWECLIMVSILLAVWLYQNMVLPIQFLESGANALKDQDYNVKFNPSGTLEMDKLIEVYNSMIDQLRTERTQQQAQHFFLERLIDASPTGLVILDFDGLITNLNESATKILMNSADEILIGQKLEDLGHPLAQAIASLEVGKSETFKLPGVEHFKCQKSEFIDRGFKRQFINISELSNEILATEKNAYGKVIRMMAHEVNNSLGAINSMLQSLQNMRVEGGQEDQNDYRTALDVAVNRNRRLTHFVRNFADIIKLPFPELKPIDLNNMMSDAAKLMEQKAIRKHIQIQLELHADSVFVQGDIDQLELVMVNVIKNAIESIGEQGEVICKTSPKTLEIIDNGRGVSKDFENKIFTPFFSSKPEGQGIGLTLTREILSNHGAQFSLKTHGEWTTFKVVFS